MTRGLVFALALASFACASETSAHALATPTVAEWREARARLASLRERIGTRPHTTRLGLALKEPFTGKIMNARGAVAVKPPSSLRMILLGPGGTTALDFWLEDDRFRFVVPAIDLKRRGDAQTPRASMKGLPIDFLHWWMLRPAEGKLLYADRTARGDRYVLKDGAAVVDMTVAPSGAVHARRTLVEAIDAEGDRAFVSDEIVDADKLGCGKVHYHQANTGLDIDVTCEGEEQASPNPRAFVDPDSKEAHE